MALPSEGAILILVNPRAGGGRTQGVDWAKVCAHLGAACRVEIAPTSRDALALASEFCASGGRVLVVAGGDGTVHTVLPALLNTDTVLALCPLGTSNVLARELGYRLGRRAVTSCLRALQTGERKLIDIGLLNGRPFVLMASTGFDTHVLARVPEDLKRRWGVMAFIWTGLRELRHYQPARYRLWLDDVERELDAVMVVATNTAHYGWFTRIAPSARIDDGWLDVVWFHTSSRWRQRIWRVVADVVRGLAHRCPHLQTSRARRVRIECASVQDVQCDGELVAQTPVEVSVVSRSLRVIAASPPAPSRSAA